MAAGRDDKCGRVLSHSAEAAYALRREPHLRHPRLHDQPAHRARAQPPFPHSPQQRTTVLAHEPPRGTSPLHPIPHDSDPAGTTCNPGEATRTCASHNQTRTRSPSARSLSVMVPVYNVERYLPQCVDSKLVQDYDSIDVVLLDDGSTDGCPALCGLY